MPIIDALLAELEQEATTTRRVLERVPADRLTWRPHAKSRTLGELALHVAIVPGGVASLVASPSPAQAPNFVDPPLKSAGELVPALEASIARAKTVLAGLSDADLTSPWTLKSGERELFTRSRLALLRAVMLNHWYHHRGQLTVYLRELDVPLPSIYGPSADENPFG